jgi:hypothetical protein
MGTDPKHPDRRSEVNPWLQTEATTGNPAKDAPWYRKYFPVPTQWKYDDIDNNKDTAGAATAKPNDERYTSRAVNWRTDIRATQTDGLGLPQGKTAPSWTLNWNKDIYIDLVKDVQELIDDCDLDCQAKGSQLTAIAGLNSLALFFIMIQALFMFIGTWKSWARIFQVYCNFFTCIFQFAILCVSAAMLFTKYATFCGQSVVRTAGDIQWTMRDDYQVIVMLWATQFIWMFAFFFCGLCGAHRCSDK